MKACLKTLGLPALAWVLMASQLLSAQVVALASAAQVTGEIVRLSNLLPHGVPDELFHASEGIELGRTPRFGSVRIFEGVWLREILIPYPEIKRRLVIPDRIIITRSGYPLSPAAIRSAVADFLQKKGAVADLPDSALQWSNAITASDASPALEVRGSNWDAGRGRFQLRVRCLKPQSCRDFLVYLQKLPGILPPTNWTATPANKPTTTASEKDAILITSGRKIRLLIEGNGMHISLQVISLQNGRLGESIRVRQVGSPHVFRAQVMSSDLLWSKLES